MDRAIDVPALGVRYDNALALALDYLCERFEPTAVVVTGSIVRGHPDASSDLDIFIFHAEPWRQRIQRSFGGVPVELFVNHPGFMESYFAEDLASGRPTTAHMLATGHLALDRDGCMTAWIDRAREFLAAGPAVSDEQLTNLRYSTTMVFEDALDSRANDAGLATNLLHDAVAQALRFRFWQARRWQPRAKDLMSALAALDAELAALARRYYRAGTLAERVDLAGAIIQRTTGETGAFDWESPRDPLPAG